MQVVAFGDFIDRMENLVIKRAVFACLAVRIEPLLQPDQAIAIALAEIYAQAISAFSEGCDFSDPFLGELTAMALAMFGGIAQWHFPCDNDMQPIHRHRHHEDVVGPLLL